MPGLTEQGKDGEDDAPDELHPQSAGNGQLSGDGLEAIPVDEGDDAREDDEAEGHQATEHEEQVFKEDFKIFHNFTRIYMNFYTGFIDNFGECRTPLTLEAMRPGQI